MCNPTRALTPRLRSPASPCETDPQAALGSSAPCPPPRLLVSPSPAQPLPFALPRPAGEEASCGGKLFEEEESLLSLPTSHEGNSPQPTASDLLLQERQRAHEWPKVTGCARLGGKRLSCREEKRSVEGVLSGRRRLPSGGRQAGPGHWTARGRCRRRPCPSPRQDRVLINRIDLVCQAVLSGKWPSALQGALCVGQGEGLSRLHGEYTSTPIPHICPLAAQEDGVPSFTRLRHSGPDKEFTVQIKDVSKGRSGAGA